MRKRIQGMELSTNIIVLFFLQNLLLSIHLYNSELVLYLNSDLIVYFNLCYCICTVLLYNFAYCNAYCMHLVYLTRTTIWTERFVYLLFKCIINHRATCRPFTCRLISMVHQDIDYVVAVEDFGTFVRIMYMRNLKLQEQAILMLLASNGRLPPSFDLSALGKMEGLSEEALVAIALRWGV